MIPNITRGGKIAGFMNYLVGPGRFNEHTNPRVVAADDTVLAFITEGEELSVNDALDIANILEHPRRVHGTAVTSPVKEWDEQEGKRITTGRKASHMWQCSLSNGPDDDPLTDAAWQRIAEEFVDRMGFVDPDGAKTSRWVAVHHGVNKNGNDHIHLVVQMVREDGTKAQVHNDARRAQDVCAALEREFGLTITEGRAAEKTMTYEKRGERGRAERERAPWVEKKELRRRLRAALGASSTEAEFVRNVFSSGVIIEPRFAKGGTDSVVGYRVALPPPDGCDRDAIRYAPSKLEAGLSLPKVREYLGVPRSGDPAAVAAWQEHHRGGANPQRTSLPRASESLAERVQAGTATATDLSYLFAGVSLVDEGDTPSSLATASDHMAQLGPDLSPGYQARQMERAGSRDTTVAWAALLRQACRLSTVMLHDEYSDQLPKLTQRHDDIIRVVIEPPSGARNQGPTEPSQAERDRAARMGVDDKELARIRSNFGNISRTVPGTTSSARPSTAPKFDPSRGKTSRDNPPEREH